MVDLISTNCGLVRFLHIIVLVDFYAEKVETLDWAHLHVNIWPRTYYASLELT